MMIIETKYSVVYDRDMSLHGAFSDDDTLTFTLSFSESISHVVMVIHGDGWGREKTIYQEYPLVHIADEKYALTLSLSQLCRTMEMEHSGLFYYHYRVETPEKTVYLGGESPTKMSILDDDCNGERQLLVYTHTYIPPASFNDGVIYHIFVDRFAVSKTVDKTGWLKPGAVMNTDWTNGVPQYGAYPGAEVQNNVFFGGDLYGIAEQLPYIATLGVTTLYLSPVFDAASNHKYDTGDYLHVDRMFGGDLALQQLCQKAKQLGIRILLDGVFNHTGSDSVYFNKDGHYASCGAYQSKDSPYSSWYTFQHFPDMYSCWWGVKILPRLSTDDQTLRTFLFQQVIPKWMHMGVYGWRLDVADELSDDFLVHFRKIVREERADSVIIGEVWEDATDKVSYSIRRQYFCGNELDGVMNYPLRTAIVSYIRDRNFQLFQQTTERMYRRYPKWASDNQMNFLGTHDTIRILTALGGELEGNHTNAELAEMHMTALERQKACRNLILAYAILAAMPGVPSVFYGDEVGLEGYRDPFCRRTFPWEHMEPLLLDAYQKIGMVRKRESIFRDGEYQLIQCTAEHLLFARTPFSGEKYWICVAVNLAEKKALLSFAASRGDCESVLSLPEEETDAAELPAQSVRYLRCPLSLLPEQCSLI